MSNQTTKIQHPNQEEIAKLAYEIFEKEGRPHGRNMEHWLQAELLLLATRRNETKAAEKKVKTEPMQKSRPFSVEEKSVIKRNASSRAMQFSTNA